MESHECAFIEEEIEFKYYNGFALSQKQKCIQSLHQEIRMLYPKKKILEISSKSEDALGVALSAFNLKYKMSMYDNPISLENVFQGSKVFENGGPYNDLLISSPKDAKRDERLKQSGSLVRFELEGIIFELEPKTMFYDWIYLKALGNHPDLIKALMDYQVFTDIEFNHTKSFNCQARSVAIFKSLYKQKLVNKALSSINEFKRIYDNSAEQIKLDI